MTAVWLDGLEHLLDQVPAAVLAVDLQSRVLLWNEGAERLYGWSRAETLGRSVRELLLLDQPLADEVAAATHAGQVWSGEMEVLHRDGSRLLVAVQNAPLVLDGQVCGVIGVSLGRTEARRVEAERAEAVRSLGDSLRGSIRRLQRLQALTSELMVARTQQEVLEAVVTAGREATGAAA